MLDLSMNVTISSLFLFTPIEKSDIYTSEAHGCCSRHGLNQHGVLPLLQACPSVTVVVLESAP